MPAMRTSARFRAGQHLGQARGVGAARRADQAAAFQPAGHLNHRLAVEAELGDAGQRQHAAGRAVERKVPRGNDGHQPAAAVLHLQREAGLQAGALHPVPVAQRAGGCVGHAVGHAGQPPGAELLRRGLRQGGAGQQQEGKEALHPGQYSAARPAQKPVSALRNRDT
jgi:hypothetical protein